MTALTPLTARLVARQELVASEVAAAAAALAAPEVADAAKAEFLLALADKGETAAEVAEFARAFRARAEMRRVLARMATEKYL